MTVANTGPKAHTSGPKVAAQWGVDSYRHLSRAILVPHARS